MIKRFVLLGGRKKAKGLSLAAVASVLVATLWPFNAFPRNGVSWLEGSNGLNFENVGVVVSNEPSQLPEISGEESCTVELFLRPARIRPSQTILAFYSPIRARQFLVIQSTDGLVMTHDPWIKHDSSGTIKVGIGHIFHPGTPVFVAISSGRNGTTVYLDGQRAQSFPAFEVAGRDLSGEMIVGTSPMEYKPWSGELRGLAVYAKELTPQEAFQHDRSWTDLNRHPAADLNRAIARYTFAESSGIEIHNEVTSRPDLKIPATFRVPHKPFLASPVHEFRTDHQYAHDVAINIAGFVPLGLIIFSYLAWTRTPWKATVATIAFSGLLSFVIEVSQYYIPKRGSGITDIITNTLGAALGAFLMQSNLVRKPLGQFGIIPRDAILKHPFERHGVNRSVICEIEVTSDDEILRSSKSDSEFANPE